MGDKRVLEIVARIQEGRKWGSFTVDPSSNNQRPPIIRSKFNVEGLYKGNGTSSCSNRGGLDSHFTGPSAVTEQALENENLSFFSRQEIESFY